jgi:hypothetical protein
MNWFWKIWNAITKPGCKWVNDGSDGYGTSWHCDTCGKCAFYEEHKPTKCERDNPKAVMLPSWVSKIAAPMATCCQSAFVKGFNGCEASLVPRAYQDGLEKAARIAETIKPTMANHKYPSKSERHLIKVIEVGMRGATADAIRAAMSPERKAPDDE